MKKSKFLIGIFAIFSIVSIENKLYAYNEIQGIFKSGNRENKNTSDSKQSKSENIQIPPQVEIVNDPMWEYYIEYHERIDAELQDVYDNPSHETAIRHMVWVEVPIWKLKNGLKKIYKKLYYNDPAGGDIVSWPYYLKLKLWILRSKELKSGLM